MSLLRTYGPPLLGGLGSAGLSLTLARYNPEMPAPDAAFYLYRAAMAVDFLRAGDLGGLVGLATELRPNPGLLPTLIGLAQAGFGETEAVALWVLTPFHLALALGLWWGGQAMGGRGGGLFAMLAGIAAPAMLANGHHVLLDVPLTAMVALLIGGMAAGRDTAAGVGLAGALLCKLAAGPMLFVVALYALAQRRWRVLAPAAAVILIFFLPGLPRLLSYAGGDANVPGTYIGLSATLPRLMRHLGHSLEILQPALAAALVAVLMLVGSVAVVRLCGGMLGMLLGISLVSHNPQPRYVLPLVPVAAIAVAALPGRYRLGAAVAVGVQSGLAFAGIPSNYVLLSRPETPPVEEALRWIEGRRGPAPRLRVATNVDAGGPLSVDGLRLWVRHAKLPLDLIGVDAESPLTTDCDMGVAFTRTDRASPRQAWRDLLPPPDTLLAWPEYAVMLWDRPLPPETLLSEPDPGRHHPSRQGLFVRLPDGSEQGPLLQPASSAEVVRTDAGYRAYFVRDQQLWSADSADGLSFGEPRPLGITAFDPTIGPDGGLWVAELSSDNTQVDPASAPTQIVRYRPEGEGWARDRAVLSGVGFVDPSLRRRPEGGLELYFTEAGTAIRRAIATDGLNFQLDLPYALRRATVPFITSDGRFLFFQRMVMSEAVLYLLPVGADVSRDIRSLEVCGTGASVAGDRLYYTRDAEQPRCTSPIVIPWTGEATPWLTEP